jgi:hypothetical protein
MTFTGPQSRHEQPVSAHTAAHEHATRIARRRDHDRLQCERCEIRSPLRVENAAVVVPAGWRRDDVHLCWRCVEHTEIGAFLEQHS